MKYETFLVMGRSGAGKGTQAKILNEYVKSHDEEKYPVLYVETGPRFRQLIKGEGYTSELARRVNEDGGRQPDFLAIWNWTEMMKENLVEKMHIIVDGAPRSLLEAQILDTAFRFYKREKTNVIYINVSGEWSRIHLLKRGRLDDTTPDIENKIKWFEQEVIPAVDFFRNSSDYNFIEVNGEQDISKVSNDILEALKW